MAGKRKRGPGRPFEKGHAKFGGRTKGTRFKLEQTQAALEEALTDWSDKDGGGGVGFLKRLMRDDPRTFVAIWRDHIPKHIDLSANEPLVVWWKGERPT